MDVRAKRTQDSHTPAYHAVAADAVASALGTEIALGLSTATARQRLLAEGSNTIEAVKGRSVLGILFDQFRNPIVYVLVVAAVVSMVLGDALDAIAIAAVIVINASIGFFLEYQASRSMKLLSGLTALMATTLRDGNRTIIDGTELVTGDVMLVEAGDLILADGRILSAVALQVSESALTGESIPVEKSAAPTGEDVLLAERTSMLYRGTHVTRGSAMVLVTATGMRTELGRIASMVSESEQSATPLEKKLQVLSTRMIVLTIGIAVLVLVSGLVAGRPVFELLTVIIALSVAAIPEGLPIVATVALARGMLRMARSKVVVKYLSSVETIGSADVICTDKTGTLTENSVAVECLETSSGRHVLARSQGVNDTDVALIITCGVLCNNAFTASHGVAGDALEIALLRAAMLAGYDVEQTRRKYPRLSEIPFSSETKIMATLHRHEDLSEARYSVFAKGATQELLKLQLHEAGSGYSGRDEKSDAETVREYWEAAEQRMASEGMRVIGVAHAEHDQPPADLLTDLRFLGLVGMIDPVRSDVKGAIQTCMEAGIRVVMITGDHPTTALKIASELGITTSQVVVTGAMMDASDPTAWVNELVFARVSPAHKLALVSGLQDVGHVVVMTGDGINDAPSLKKADVGIAMGIRGVAVAQDVADVVLKDDAFTSIVTAVKEGRIIFRNIRMFAVFLLSGNLSELMVIGATAVLDAPYQLAALQILFINLLSDVLPALALGFTGASDKIMLEKPRGLTDPIIGRNHWRQILVNGIVIGIASLAAVFTANQLMFTQTPAHANDVFFFTLVLAQLIHVFNMGDGKRISKSVSRNRYVWMALAINVVLLVVACAVPFTRAVLRLDLLDLPTWMIVLAFAGLSFCANYFLKRLLSTERTATSHE